MILDKLERSSLYEPMHPLFATAFEFLRRPDLASMPVGKHEIIDGSVYVLIGKDDSRGPSSPLESHRKFIDIQFVIAGDEKIGWRPTDGLSPTAEYETDRDIQFFRDEPATWFSIKPGEFAIFMPTDAHAPLAGTGAIHKAVVKVALDGKR
jgi:biofilm protein TabA